MEIKGSIDEHLTFAILMILGIGVFIVGIFLVQTVGFRDPVIVSSTFGGCIGLLSIFSIFSIVKLVKDYKNYKKNNNLYDGIVTKLIQKEKDTRIQNNKNYKQKIATITTELDALNSIHSEESS